MSCIQQSLVIELHATELRCIKLESACKTRAHLGIHGTRVLQNGHYALAARLRFTNIVNLSRFMCAAALKCIARQGTAVLQCGNV